MQAEVDLSQHSYAFAVPCYEGNLVAETALSLLDTIGNLSRLGINYTVLMVRGGALIHSVRNELAERFLKETKCDTLVWVDADIEFTWEGFQRLAVWSHMYPIVAGAYQSRKDPPTFTINHKGNELNEYGLLPINGLGMGFCAVQRRVYEEMDVPKIVVENGTETTYRKYFYGVGLQNPHHVENVGEVWKDVGEDIWFFRAAEKAGFDAYCDPAIHLKHHGRKTYDFPFSLAVNKILGEKNGIQTD